MSAPAKVLVVEDSHTVRAYVTESLRAGGYDVRGVEDGRRAMEQFRSYCPDVVVLDVDLPGIDGWEVLERIRAADEQIAVLMLTATNGEASKVRGLVSGADDYLVKPTGSAELRARVGALLRRAGRSRRVPERVLDGPYDDGRLRLDPQAHVVTVHGRAVTLTPLEFKLLTALVAHAGHVVSQEELLERVWEAPPGHSRDLVKVYVGYLRRKLRGATSTELVETVRGFGYRYNPPAESSVT